AQIAGSLTRAAIDETTYAIFTGGKINYAQIVGDAFGNAVVNAQIGLTPGQEQDMNAQIAAGAKASMQNVDTEVELDNSTQLQMQQVSGQVAADNQAYFTQQESDFNASQGLRDLAIDGEYSVQTNLTKSLQNSLANLQAPQVNQALVVPENTSPDGWQLTPDEVQKGIAMQEAQNNPTLAQMLGVSDAELEHTEAEYAWTQSSTITGLESMANSGAYVFARVLGGAVQPLAQTVDLAQVAFAGVYNQFSKEPYQLTPYSTIGETGNSGD